MHDIIVKKVFNKTFLGLTFLNSFWIIGGILNTILAGKLFGSWALTAVGISSAFVSLISLVVTSISEGTSACLGNEIGRGNYKRVSELYTISLKVMFIFGSLVVLASFIFAKEIAFILGARDSRITEYAVNYIRAISLMLIPLGIYYQLGDALVLMGNKKCYLISNLVYLILNFVSAYAYVKIFNMGVEGLALGTLTAYLVSNAIAGGVVAKNYRDKFHFVFGHINDVPGALKRIFIHTIPTFCDKSATSVTSLILNNIVAIYIGVNGLTILALVYSLRSIAQIITDTLDWEVSAYSSLMFGARDTAGLRQLVKSSVRLPIVVTVIVCICMFIFRVPLLAIYGVTDISVVNVLKYYLIALILSSAEYLFTFIEAPFYTETESIRYGVFCSVIPDALLYLPITYILIRMVGVSGIWIGEIISYFLFQILLIFMVRRKIGHMPRNIDDMMMLPREYYDDSEVFSLSIRNNAYATAGISEQIQKFLENMHTDKRKAYFAALCVEEIATLIKEADPSKEKHIDINIFTTNQNKIRISIRNSGKECNYLLAHEQDSVAGIGIKIVKNVASDVRFTRIAEINILSIVM